MRKGKDRRKAWKRRILPGCLPPAPGTADVPSPASHGRAPSAQPGHPQPRHLGYRDAPWARPPHIPPPCLGAGRGARGVRRPDAGCGSPPPSVQLSIFPAGPPLPQRNGAGAGSGGRQGQGSHPPWLEPLPGDPQPAVGFAPSRLLARRSPGGVIFGRGWETRPGGRAPINVPLSPLFGGLRQLGAWTPAPISMETCPGLGKRSRASVSPPGSGEGGRGDIRLSAP